MNNNNEQNKEQNKERRNPNPYRQNNQSTKPNNNANNVKREGTDARKPQNTDERKPNNRNNNRPNNNRPNNRNNNRPNNTQNKSKNRPNNNKNRGRRKPEPTNVSAEMKECLLANDKIQQARIAPWKQVEQNSNGKIRFTPLGGLGEIGGNIAVMETEKSAFIIDVGMSFPDETMHGVDILVPDFSYLHTIKDKIKGIVITHSHEDHIGAMPYLFKELKFPIYGTPLALAMIENKFNEHGLSADTKYFNYVTKREQYQIGDFKIEWMHVTHSIVDSSSLAIETPAGTIIHTADFKIDHTPIDGLTTDLHRFAHYGSKGVLCLFSDSTNSHNPGFTKSEMVVGKTFDTLFDIAKGRVIMSTFSSNVHRIYQAMERGVKHGRKICVIGRSMERNIETTRKLGYVDIEEKYFIEPHEINRYKENEVLVITTGSQGEAMAALSRMANDEHRHIKLKPTDTVIISASAIPGNEASVSKLLNLLMKAGVTVRYKEFSDIHVSGHAAQEEQKLILRLVQPKFFLPVHGEYNHIAAHAKTASNCGVDSRNMLLMSDGDQIEITQKFIKKVKTIKSGKRYIDNMNNKEIYNDVVTDRQKLANDGIVNVTMNISSKTNKPMGPVIVNTFGTIPSKEDARFKKDILHIIDTYLLANKIEAPSASKKAQDEIRSSIRKHIVKIKKLYPIINVDIFVS